MSINFLEEMANFTFASKYARYDEKKKRRETWEETVGRVEQMHLKKFKSLSKEDKAEIKKAFDFVREKRVVPSMRSLQFGGKAIEVHQIRSYNCGVRHIDSLRSFAESFYTLLCGTGVGFGISNRFLNRLPDLVNAKDKTGTVISYIVQDNIEGWADSVEALLTCYFKNTPYTGRKIVFDYSRIRPKGAKLKTGGGKAPGYKGLKNCHSKIKRLLDFIIEENGQSRLKTINAYDILMHCADAVLSGGIRRAATAVIFDVEDEDMMVAKTGNWFNENPQRARSNNSALVMRNNLSYQQFQDIIKRTKEFGEPGFVFAEQSKDQLLNPCQNASAPILTPAGIKKLGDINIGDKIWSESGWTTVVNKWVTGIKPVYAYRTTAGVFYGTENHRLVSNGVKIEAKDCESIDTLQGEFSPECRINPQDVMNGLVFGDGSVHKASNSLVYLHIGENDADYFKSEIASFITKHRPGIHDTAYEIKTNLDVTALPRTYERDIPKEYFFGDKNKVVGFLRGLYSANGSVCGNRVTLKASSFKVIEKVQILLSSLGIKSYYTTNRASNVSFDNGDYLCKQSYDLNISTDRDRFAKLIGFIQQYKNEKLEAAIKKTKIQEGKNNYDIISSEYVSTEEVFDITVDNETHTYWTGGLNVSNCMEINFLPVTSDGRTGYQFCVTGDTNLITKDGLVSIKESEGKEIEIWNGEKWSKTKPFLSQENVPIFRVSFSDGSFLDCTLNHKFLVKKNYQESFVEKTTEEILNSIKKSYKTKFYVPRSNIQIGNSDGKEELNAYEYGYFKGDGHIAGKSNGYCYPNVCIYGEKDAKLNLKYKIVASEMTNVYGTKYFEATFDNLDANFCTLLKIGLPNEIFSWNKSSILQFIAGWADADGSNASKGIRIYGDESSLRKGQLLLTKVGIDSSINLMQESGVKTNLSVRKNAVWYLQITKTAQIPSRRLNCVNNGGTKFKGKYQQINSIVLLNKKQDVYCLTENDLHQCVFNNVLTKQCNLSSINGAKITNQQDFENVAWAVSLIGTLQAAYTSFPYLGHVAEELCKEEALLGVSITGMMDNPDVLFSAENQKKAAEVAVKTNKEWAAKIGINQSARITCIKPEGTTSIVLSSASGIHPHHSRKYFRRIQMNKEDNIFKFFKMHNPHACEESVWSANKTDEVVTFPIEISEKAVIKKDLTAIKHLELIKSTQLNWVNSGTTEANKKPLNHSVSCTVIVKDDEWEEVTKYLYDNQGLFTAVSLLPYSGDKIYKQAPMEDVVTEEDEQRFQKLKELWEKVDYTKLEEVDDETSHSQEVACAGGNCEIV